MVSVSDHNWLGLCFSKYFNPGNILGWTNLLEYHSLAVTELSYRYQIGVVASQICTARQLPVSAHNLLQVSVL